MIYLYRLFHKILIILFILFASLHLNAQDYLSPGDIDLIDNGEKLLVTDHTGKQILFFDIKTEKVLNQIGLEKEPTGSTVSQDGKKIYVTTGFGPGTIFIIDASSGKIEQTIIAGHGINTPILSKDETTLYICSRFDNTVIAIDLQENEIIKKIPLSREPVAASITPDGKFLFVANHMPDGRADVDYVASKMSVINLEKNELVNTIDLVNGAEGMRGVCVSPDGQYVFATHLMARFQVPTTQIERGWINTNAISVVRVSDQKLLYTVLLDDVDQGFSNPWAIDVTTDGKQLCVSFD